MTLKRSIFAVMALAALAFVGSVIAAPFSVALSAPVYDGFTPLFEHASPVVLGVSFLAIILATFARRSVAATLALAIFLFSGAAFAADPATTVNFRPLVDLSIEFAVAVLVAVVPAIGGWIALRANTALGLKIDAQQRAVIEQGLERAIMFGVEAAKAKLPEGPVVDVKSAAIAQAVSYAQASVPGALKHFDITPDRLAKMIESRITTNA